MCSSSGLTRTTGPIHHSQVHAQALLRDVLQVATEYCHWDGNTVGFVHSLQLLKERARAMRPQIKIRFVPF